MSRRQPRKQRHHRKIKTTGHRRRHNSVVDNDLSDEIITQLHLLGGTANSKDLLRALDWPRGSRKQLQLLLQTLISQRLITNRPPEIYNLVSPDFIQGRLTVNPKGFGFVEQEKDGRPTGAADIFVAGRNLADAIHGDTVLAQITRNRAGRLEGRIVSVIRRNLDKVVGIFNRRGKGGLVIPDDSRIRLEIAIPSTACAGAKDGDAVQVQITNFLVEKLQAQGQVEEVLGDPTQAKVQMEMTIRNFDLPHAFSAATKAQVADISAKVTLDKGREDLRTIPHVTIDGETARDFDDAVAVEKLPQGYRLYVSIADVSHYVQPGSPLDQDAYARGTSVYFPAGVLPMLPERLSNGLCSLNPNEDRYAFTAIIDFDQQGKRHKNRFCKSVISSQHRLTYNYVWDLLSSSKRDQPVMALLTPMTELGALLEKRRHRRGAINFDLPEAEIVIGADDKVKAIRRRERNQAHKLIEEFMLAANEAVASHLTTKKIPLLYRIHETPDLAKMEEFAEFAHNLFGKLPKELGTPSWFNQILAQSKGSPKEYVINNLMLRTMKQARYSPENAGHFGLAAPYYCHFTSPIRRYPDLQVHRALASTLAGSKKAKKQLNLQEAGEFLSKRERVAVDAERDMADRLKAAYMQGHIGESFTGIISGVSNFGLFIELDDLLISGAVPLTDLRDDYYSLDDKNHRLVGRRTGNSYHLGDLVTVTANRVDMAQHRITFAFSDPKEDD